MHPKSRRPTSDVNAFILHQTRYSFIFSCKSCTAIGRERASGGGAGQRRHAVYRGRPYALWALGPMWGGAGRGVLSVLSLIVRYNARSHTHSRRRSGLACRGGASTHRAISVVLSRNVAGLTPRDATCRSEGAPPRPTHLIPCPSIHTRGHSRSVLNFIRDERRNQVNFDAISTSKVSMLLKNRCLDRSEKIVFFSFFLDKL